MVTDTKAHKIPNSIEYSRLLPFKYWTPVNREKIIGRAIAYWKIHFFIGINIPLTLWAWSKHNNLIDDICRFINRQCSYIQCIYLNHQITACKQLLNLISVYAIAKTHLKVQISKIGKNSHFLYKAYYLLKFSMCYLKGAT